MVKGHSLQSLFSTTDNDFHMQFRRCVNSAFAMSALVQYEPFVDNTTKLFLKQTERLYIDNPEKCDFTRWLQFYAFDVIGEITYSKRHGFIEKNEDIDGIVAYLTKLFLYVAPVRSLVLPVFETPSCSHLRLDRSNTHPRPPLSEESHLPEALPMGLHRCDFSRRPLRPSSHGRAARG